MRLFAIILLSFAVFKASAEQAAEELMPVGEWRLSLAIGFGEFDNPIAGGDDFPLYLAPSVSYYGEKLFYDNGTFGYTLADQGDFALSITTNFNRTARYFRRWHTENWLLQSSFNPAVDTSVQPTWDLVYSDPNDTLIPTLPPGTVDPGENLKPHTITLDNLAKRKYSLDAGLQLNWFIGETSQLIAQVNTDISGIHHGQNASLSYVQWFALADTSWQLTLGADWQSNKLNSYYFGINQRDEVSKDLHYQVSSSISPFVKLSGQYQLKSKWYLVFSGSYKKLDSELVASPIVVQDFESSVFTGIRYDF